MESKKGETGGSEKPEAQKAADAQRQRFVKLAGARTNTVLAKLRTLGHCANKNTYSYSSKDATEILRAIDDEVKRLKAKFTAQGKEEEFALKI